MKSVDLLDRSELIDRMLELLELDAADTAMVTVDVHRGHLDPEIVTINRRL